MIEKFLSLKKESSRDIFIANMTEHTRARYEVSNSIFFFFKKNPGGTPQASTFTFFPFSAVRQRPVRGLLKIMT